MGNNTIFTYFYILAFSREGEKQPELFILFFFMYMFGVLGNLSIITVTCSDAHLHTPMYFLLANLSFIDICYTTTTLPKLLHILLTGNNIISFPECFTQMVFYSLTAQSEIILLAFMAYDRYVAICDPLKYHLIINNKKCAQILAAIWTSSLPNALLGSSIILELNFCGSNTIDQFFCDAKYMIKISCEAVSINYYLFFGAMIYGVLPFLLCLASYTKIIHSIFQIKSHGRKKTFSTCTSHLTVLMLFYGAVAGMYMSPPSKSDIVEPVLSLLYTVVTPMLNPFIYSLRNKEVKVAVSRLLFETYRGGFIKM
uniref:Olfactory receptor n=1 Tax=Xenopus tropicalis TaxID=8364 RepID=F7E4N7_XENTR